MKHIKSGDIVAFPGGARYRVVRRIVGTPELRRIHRVIR